MIHLMPTLDLDKIIRCLVRVSDVLNNQPHEALVGLRDISAFVDSQVPYRDGHSLRVSEYSLMTGKSIGLKPGEIVTLEAAALLHDFGKIGVDEEILVRPRSLEENERNEIKMHVLRGFHILSGFSELQEVLQGVRTHHEHFNGQGYPEGLVGERIPLHGRIIAVADAFDAITSERPYRKARSAEQALEELRLFSGEQFDPYIVGVFLTTYNA
jgi:HD-GYP domain-containing protein (c-di-GMP phosphodiesterase class II)